MYGHSNWDCVGRGVHTVAYRIHSFHMRRANCEQSQTVSGISHPHHRTPHHTTLHTRLLPCAQPRADPIGHRHAHGTPHYGIVAVPVDQVKFRAPIFCGPAEAANASNPLFRLVTDMQRRF